MNNLDENQSRLLDYMRRHRKAWHSYTALRIGLAAMDDDNLDEAIVHLRGHGYINQRVNEEAARGRFWEYRIDKRHINENA